jgi:hypothetical protein
LVPLKA